jgi:hypothetical protein
MEIQIYRAQEENIALEKKINEINCDKILEFDNFNIRSLKMSCEEKIENFKFKLNEHKEEIKKSTVWIKEL